MRAHPQVAILTVVSATLGTPIRRMFTTLALITRLPDRRARVMDVEPSGERPTCVAAPVCSRSQAHDAAKPSV
jgi:hypothetical protein